MCSPWGGLINQEGNQMRANAIEISDSWIPVVESDDGSKIWWKEMRWREPTREDALETARNKIKELRKETK